MANAARQRRRRIFSLMFIDVQLQPFDGGKRFRANGTVVQLFAVNVFDVIVQSVGLSELFRAPITRILFDGTVPILMVPKAFDCCKLLRTNLASVFAFAFDWKRGKKKTKLEAVKCSGYRLVGILLFISGLFSCETKCFFKLCLCENDDGQSSHLNGFSGRWTFWCFLSCDFV